jgi:hypothetical protein
MMSRTDPLMLEDMNSLGSSLASPGCSCQRATSPPTPRSHRSKRRQWCSAPHSLSCFTLQLASLSVRVAVNTSTLLTNSAGFLKSRFSMSACNFLTQRPCPSPQKQTATAVLCTIFLLMLHTTSQWTFLRCPHLTTPYTTEYLHTANP